MKRSAPANQHSQPNLLWGNRSFWAIPLRASAAVLIAMISAGVASTSLAAPMGNAAAFTTAEDVPRTGTLTGSGAPGAVLTFLSASAPRHGAVAISASGAFVYTPEANFNGYDKFGFLVKEGESTSEIVTVFVTVVPVNDAPTAASLQLAVPPSRIVVGQLPGVDLDGDTLTYTKVSGPNSGAVNIEPDGRFRYVGSGGDGDSFSYQVTDGRASSGTANVTLSVVKDEVGFIADTLHPLITSADFPPGPNSSEFPQLGVPDAHGALDIAVDRTNRRLYLLTRGALKIYTIDTSTHPASLLFWRSIAISKMEGTKFCLSPDGRTAYIAGTGKVTAINLYPEAVFVAKKLWGLLPAKSVVKEAFSYDREFSFPEPLRNRTAAAIGIHPAGNRLFVVIDMRPEDKQRYVQNDLLLSDLGTGTSGQVTDLPQDFGYITALDITGEVETEATASKPAQFSTALNIRDLIYPHSVAIGPRGLTFSPDGNYALLPAVGAQKPRATKFGVMPTTDEGSGGIVVFDVRPLPGSTPCVRYLGFIPTTESGEKTAELRRQIVREGAKIVHPEVQWARGQYSAALGQSDLGGTNQFTALSSLNQLTAAQQVLATLEESFRDYGNMQAYSALYPHDMVGASSVAINHRGDFGVVALQDTNNLGLLTLQQSATAAGFSSADRPDFYIETGTGKSLNGFDPGLGNAAGLPDYHPELLPYGWLYPQKAVFTSDDSRLFIGMQGGSRGIVLANRFGSANAFNLRAEHDRPSSPAKAGNRAPGFELYGGLALNSPRLAATLPGFQSDNDSLSDQLKAYNRWNSLRQIADDPQGTKKARLVSTDDAHLAIPGVSMGHEAGTATALGRGFLLPTSGVGYRRNTFDVGTDSVAFGSRTVAVEIEQIGREWDRLYQQFLRSGSVDSSLPIKRPYFLVGLLSPVGGGTRKNSRGEPLKYSPNTGSEVDLPYFSVNSDAAHDFVTSNGPSTPTNNKDETKKGFDQDSTAALIRLLLANAHVKKIELDPYVMDLLPELKAEPRVVPHGSRTIPNSRRDLDDHMFVTFAQLSVDLSIDSDNDGVLDRTPTEDTLENHAGGAKFVPPNFGDQNGNQIPDYADGYDLFGGPNAVDASARFTPMVIRFPDELDLTTTQFVLRYSGSDPAQVTRSGSGPYEYILPSTGAYRVWAKDGNQARLMAQINAGGDYIAPNVTYRVTDLLARAGSAGTNRSVTVYLESVKPDSQPDQNKVVVEIIPEAALKHALEEVAGSSALSDTIHVASGVISLAVDANRDGQIRIGGDNGDATAAATPYRFWLNDDDDVSYGPDFPWNERDPEYFPARRPDYANQIIDSPRDCEDLTRMWIDAADWLTEVKDPNSSYYLGLKWRNTAGGHPSIRIFRSADPTGGLAHIQDARVALSQIDSNGTGDLTAKRLCFGDVEAGVNRDQYGQVAEPSMPWTGIDRVTPQLRPADFVFRKEDMPALFADGRIGHLLFEAADEGKGELMIVVLRRKGDGAWDRVSEGGSVWLQLDNIRRMYVRAHSLPLPENFPLPWQVNSPPPDPFDEDLAHEKALSVPDNRLWYGAGDSVESSSQFPFVASPGEQNKCVIFVHGIDMPVPDMHGYAESCYKRLWWEGYRGRFVSFRWATPLSSDGQFGWEDQDENTSIFNSGEYRSWKGGASLKKFVDALRNPASPFYFGSNPTIGLLAHSLGNACAGEALRQGMQVNSYVALKAAVPLSCYFPVGTAAPARQILVDADAIHPTPQYAGFYNGYHGYLSSIGGPNKVNYYGARDFWLETGTTSFGLSVSWVTNMRKFKPDDPWDHWTNSSLIKYLWDSNQLKAYFRRDAFYRLVTDPHESMAFVSRPRTSALGAVAPPSGFSDLDLEAFYGFTEARFDHSGPFQRDIQLMYGNENGVPWVDASGAPFPLYQRLMRDLQVSP